MISLRPSNHLLPRPSFERVVVPEIPVLYRVAKRMGCQDSDAEDVVGQTLLIAARSWETFDGRHLRSWLIQILRNEVFSLVRKRNRREEVAISETAEPMDEGFWREIQWRSIGDRLFAELDRLPEEYRMAVALCDVEELSYEEASAAMNVPVGTVRSRLFRGRRLLRSRLVHCMDEDGGNQS